jgi:AcrR family transcriptional regulator
MEEIDNKEKILIGAEELFLKFGVRSVSMDDIARHLSVSKKTLYQHFADKDELVTMMADRHMKQDKKSFEVITKQSKNAIDELVKISEFMKRHLHEMNPSLLFDLQKFHTKAWNVWLDYRDNYVMKSVVRNLKQGIEEGYFRPDINPEILAMLRIEGLELGFDVRKFPSGKFNLTEVQLQVFDHFIYGLLIDKGRRLYEKYKYATTKKQ